MKAPQKTVINIENLSLGYGREDKLLHSFSATIKAGEFIGIFGPNAAGKSTFLRALLGLLKPLSGTLKVLGAVPGQKNTEIGYMPQFRNFSQTYQLSGRAILSTVWNGYRYGIPWLNKADKNRLQEIINWVEANDFIDKPFVTLSGGQQQRIALAQALFNQPKILLLDEPLTHLDPLNQELLIHFIQKIQQELNTAVLFTAHDVNPLLQVMDKVLYIVRGNAAIGKVEDIITSNRLTQLYQTPIEVIQHAGRLFVFSQERGEFEYGSH